MRRLGVLLLLTMVAAGGLAPGPTVAAGAGTVTRHDDAGRPYLVYTPPNSAPGRPLVVHLHGCNQDAADAVAGSRWPELADRFGFVVAFPEQPLEFNGGRCWNWFLPEHQARDEGEPAVIVDIASRVAARHGSDRARTFVNGISAGGAMASVMAATYPDVFAAVGVVAGIAYRGDASGAVTWDAMGEHARAVPAFVVHGTIDPVVAYPAAAGSVSAWLGVADLADDGVPNGSVSRQPMVTEHTGTDQTPSPGSGDACLRPTRLPCAGGAAGLREYPATVNRWNGTDGRPLVELLTIHGAGHSHVGGNPEGNWTDPIGPGESAAAWAFFERVGAGR